jgi:CHAD domain-containing protein
MAETTLQRGIRPVSALKAQVVALDAAMLVALSLPAAGAVHKLRTSTRRVESQLMLLEVLAKGPKPLALPPHADEVAAVRKRLHKVRQAAGAVRDLDVQCDAIDMDAPSKTAVHKGSPGDALRKEAKTLRKHLAARRDHEAATLADLLKAEETKLAASLGELELALQPTEARPIAQAVLIERIESWFAQATRAVLKIAPQPGEALSRGVMALGADDLHALRKAAKLCRYMAESAPEGSRAHAMSARFEAMQEAGGLWHDWLLLERLSASFHGKEAGLTVRYRKHRDAALADYQLRLVELLPAVAARPPKPAAAKA